MVSSSLVVAFFVGLLVICIASKILSFPIHILWRFIYNSVFGALALWLINFVFGLHVPITFLTSLIVGIFGVPGALGVVIWHLL